jgi:hypothetical protein
MGEPALQPDFRDETLFPANNVDINRKSAISPAPVTRNGEGTFDRRATSFHFNPA